MELLWLGPSPRLLSVNQSVVNATKDKAIQTLNGYPIQIGNKLRTESTTERHRLLNKYNSVFNMFTLPRTNVL